MKWEGIMWMAAGSVFSIVVAGLFGWNRFPASLLERMCDLFGYSLFLIGIFIYTGIINIRR